MRFLMTFLLEVLRLVLEIAVEVLKIAADMAVMAVRLAGWLILNVVVPGVRGLATFVIAVISRAAGRGDDDERWGRR